jgi:lipocalin
MMLNKKGGIGWFLIIIVVVLGLVWYSGTKLTSFSKDVEVVEDLDVEKYMGEWQEIGNIPTWFQRGLSDVTATYTLRDDGSIGVLNQGVKADGEVKARYASAEVFGPGRLKVSFFPLSKADYNVLYVDEFYSYALVGGGNSKYLWILSRTGELDQRVIDGLLAVASEQGYKVDKFVLAN